MSLFTATSLYNYQPITTAALSYNYVTGSTIIYDFGNPSCYGGSGATFQNVGEGGSIYSGSIINGGTYSSTYGGVINLQRASSQYLTWSGSFATSFSTMAIIKYSDTGSTFDFYDGIPEQNNNNGVLYTTLPATAPNPSLLVYVYNGAAGTTLTNCGQYTMTADTQNQWHGYSFTTNGSNNHKTYLDTTNKSTSTTAINRTSYTPTRRGVYFGRELLNNHYTDGLVMAYLQYPFALSQADINQNMAVFSSRF